MAFALSNGFLKSMVSMPQNLVEIGNTSDVRQPVWHCCTFKTAECDVSHNVPHHGGNASFSGLCRILRLVGVPKFTWFCSNCRLLIIFPPFSSFSSLKKHFSSSSSFSIFFRQISSIFFIVLHVSSFHIIFLHFSLFWFFFF